MVSHIRRRQREETLFLKALAWWARQPMMWIPTPSPTELEHVSPGRTLVPESSQGVRQEEPPLCWLHTHCRTSTVWKMGNRLVFQDRLSYDHTPPPFSGILEFIHCPTQAEQRRKMISPNWLPLLVVTSVHMAFPLVRLQSAY